MDPEDVLDFGDDDDGLDVISLGGSDHDGRPVSNRSSSVVSDYVSSISRGTPHVRPTSPSRARHLTSPHSQLNGSHGSRSPSTSRTQKSPQPHPLVRRNHTASNSDPPTSNATRPSRGGSSRESDRSVLVEAPRTRLLSDRPKPGERASYMPPDRLQAISQPPRASDSVNSSNSARHPVPSLSTRITDHRHADPKIETHSSSSKRVHEPDKCEGTTEVEKPVTSEGTTKELKSPVPSSVDSSAEKLPEGWISRISKAGKIYYVNVFTRTSKWARPTEPAIGKPVKPIDKVTSKSLDTQPISAEASEIPTNQTQANVQKTGVTVLSDSHSVVSRSQDQAPDLQLWSRSLCDSSDKLRHSSKVASYDHRQSANTLDPHSEISNSVEHVNRQSNMTVSGSNKDFGNDISTRPLPQERPPSAISDSCPKGPRIHPDRRQEIVAASQVPPSSESKNRDYHHRGEFVRHLPEPETFRPRANPRHLSVSTDLGCVSSNRPLERHPREPPQLSGANGIPTAPGRSFHNPRRSPRSPKDFIANPDSERYNKSVLTPRIPAKHHVAHGNADWWRGTHDDSLNRNAVSQHRVPAQWSSRGASLTHSSDRHRLSLRARSPSPPPRRMPLHQDFQRGHPDLHRSERSRPPPASNRTLLEDRNSPHSSDVTRRNTISRYDAYRPSSSSPMVTNGLRPQDSRREDACPSRDQGPRHIDHSEVDPRRSQAVKPTSVLPDLHKTSPAVAQPDLYRPPPRGLVARKLSPRRGLPLKHDTFIDLDEVISKDGSLHRPLSEKKSNNLPSESASQGNPSTETSHSPVLQGPDKTQGSDRSKPSQNDVKPLPTVASEPPTLTAPAAYEGNEPTCAPSSEMKHFSESTAAKASSDAVIMPSPKIAVSPKQTLPLAKRLGPVAAYSSASDQLTPPTKRHRRNPAEKSEADDRSNVPDTFKVSSLEEKNSSGIKTDPSPKRAVEKIKSQSESEGQPNEIDGFPEMLLSPVQVSPDKVISLRGRAARQSGEIGVVEQPGSKIQGKATAEPTPIGGGSLRDRIQDLNLPAVRPMRSRQFSYGDSPHHIPQNSVDTRAPDTYQVRPGIEDGQPPTPRHISERISGFGVPIHSPSSNGNYRSPRYTPRQSDSGWSGRRAKYH